MNKTNKTKKCTKCNRILPISEFAKCKDSKDKLQYWCRECKNKHNQTHKEYYSQYYKEYYQTNKEHLNQYQKDYQKQFKGYYLYIILDKQGNIVYVGQTTNYYKRLINHLSGGNDSTKELFDSGNWGSIQYLDVGHIVANEMELKALENELIHLYQPKLNTLLNIIRDIDEDRLFSITTQLHSMDNEWEEFRTNV